MEKGNVDYEKDQGLAFLWASSPVCLSPPHYLGEYALRRTLREGAAGVE